MKNAFGMGFFVVMLLLCTQSFAAPLIEVSDYSTTPATVYPNTWGYLKLTIANKGDMTADSVAAHYWVGGVESSAFIGGISSGSTAQVAVPFVISSGAGGGIQLVNVDIYFSYKEATSSPSTKTSLSVPIVVSQYNPLEVKTLSIGGPAISAGEKVPIELQLINNGGVTNNIIISIPTNSSFYLDGESQRTVGSIASNSSSDVSLTLASSSDATTGTYSIPLVLTYQDALNQPVEETLSIGPVSIMDSSMRYRLSMEPQTTVEVGSKTVFTLSLENTGSLPVSAIVEANSTDVFSPLGMQTVYFDTVPANSTVSRNMTIGVSSSASAGYYTLPLQLTPTSGKPATFNVGIPVEATPEVTVSLTLSGTTAEIMIANTGNTQIRSVNVVARQAGSRASTESFMGTLNVDDYSTLSLEQFSNFSSPDIDVNITFRDSSNALHAIEKKLSATGLAGASTRQNGASSAATNRTRSNGGPFGLFSSGGSQTDLALPLIVLAIAAVGGYLVYRRFFAKGKAK